MDRDERKILKEDIRVIKKEQIQDIMEMFGNWFLSYLYCLVRFGIEHEVTKDTGKAFKEYLDIIREEKRLFSIMLKYAKSENYDLLNGLLEDLNMLSFKTEEYYAQFFSDVKDSAILKQSWRGKRPIKNFETLIETDEYQERLSSLQVTFLDVKNFLNYEEEFWQYFDENVKWFDTLDVSLEEEFYVGYSLDDNDCIDELELVLPEVIDLQTALCLIDCLQNAYELYKLLGKKEREVEDNSKAYCEKFKAYEYNRIRKRVMKDKGVL